VTARSYETEEAFISAFRAGEPLAQAELFRRHYRRVNATLVTLLGRDADLHDVAQEVFVRAIAGAPRFRGSAAQLEGWLTHIAVFTARGVIRQRRSFRRFFSMKKDVLPDVPCPPVCDEHVEAVRRTYAVFERIAATERVPLSLRLIDSMPIAEIAEVCGVSLSTAKRRLLRGRRRFDRLVDLDPLLRTLASANGL
jgi:RNA polymerase sigma-70 factor (ECF subfamily)